MKRIKIADGFHLWSERYDLDMKDLFETQGDYGNG
jgi:TolB-like protein